MVNSRISNEIHYNEIKTVHPEDVDAETAIYELNLYDVPVEIGIGKPKYEFASKHVIYMPLYLIQNNEVVCRIGVYELKDNELLQNMDAEKSYILKERNVLIYVSKEYLNRVLDKIPKVVVPVSQEKDAKDATDLGVGDADALTQDEDDVFKLRIPEEKQSLSVKEANEVIKTGIFITNANATVLPLLPEETYAENHERKKMFKENARHIWLQTYMKNEEYAIVDNEGSGDCFFAVIRDAFKDVGKETTVEKLRAILSKEATEELYTQYRSLYVGALAEFQDHEKELKDMKQNIALLKKRVDTTSNKEANQELLTQIKSLLNQYTEKRKDTSSQSLLNEFQFMTDVTNLELLREKIKTQQYWADDWAISTLENVLNVKCIILSVESYESGDLDSVIQCGQSKDAGMDTFNPDYYIMTVYRGDHYTLATYKNKGILKFKEVPFGVKCLIINKCMERNAGTYYLIDDFRNLKTRLGLPANEGQCLANDDDTEFFNRDLYNNDTVFQFYAAAGSKPKAGKGSNEKIPNDKLFEYNVLNTIVDWRRMLDDTWSAPFTVDGKRWKTVEHYVLASRFKKGFPTFYTQFSIDGTSELAQDLALAHKVADADKIAKDVVANGIVLREKKVVADPGFYEARPESRHAQERFAAVQAKFMQNLDLQKALAETRDAKLVRFQRGKEAEPDEILMKVRRLLRTRV